MYTNGLRMMNEDVCGTTVEEPAWGNGAFKHHESWQAKHK